MKQISITIATFLLINISVSASDPSNADIKPWRLKGVSGMNLTQTSLSSWSAGGDNYSLAGNVYLNGSLIHKSGPWLWSNMLALDYGITNSESQGVQKSTDKIEFSTQLGYTTNHKWYYTGMVDFKSQFYKGYNYPNRDIYISKFMAPAYSNLSLGVEYRPNDKFSIYFSPVAGKFTFVQDDSLSNAGAFGVKQGRKFKAEMGAYLNAKAQKKLMENVFLISKIDFFSAYNKSFGNIDIEWDVLINMRINKYLAASINTTIKYDDDVKYIDKEGNKHGSRIQFREILGVGFTYNFQWE